jgi:hypothetical protein
VGIDEKDIQIIAPDFSPNKKPVFLIATFCPILFLALGEKPFQQISTP